VRAACVHVVMCGARERNNGSSGRVNGWLLALKFENVLVPILTTPPAARICVLRFDILLCIEGGCESGVCTCVCVCVVQCGAPTTYRTCSDMYDVALLLAMAPITQRCCLAASAQVACCTCLCTLWL
jgi:hypothetical protein